MHYIGIDTQAAILFAETKSSEPLSEQTKHKKIIEKGLPENVTRGVKGRNVCFILVNVVY